MVWGWMGGWVGVGMGGWGRVGVWVCEWVWVGGIDFFLCLLRGGPSTRLTVGTYSLIPQTTQHTRHQVSPPAQSMRQADAIVMVEEDMPDFII